MLIEFAIADAYGAGFEFKNSDFIEKNNDGKTYRTHAFGGAAGCYTDDTQMSLAVADLVLNKTKVVWTPSVVAYSFLKVYRADPRKTYAKGFLSVLESVRDEMELVKRLKPGSNRNGAAMRVLPVAFLPDRNQVWEAAAKQASLTHNTPDGMDSAAILAVVARDLIEGATLDEIKKNLEYNWMVRPVFMQPWPKQPVPCDAMSTVRAVLTKLFENRSLHKLMMEVVALGGDTDTNAALAVGLGSLSFQYEYDFPDDLYAGLEDGKFGFAHLMEIDRKLKIQLRS